MPVRPGQASEPAPDGQEVQHGEDRVGRQGDPVDEQVRVAERAGAGFAGAELRVAGGMADTGGEGGGVEPLDAEPGGDPAAELQGVGVADGDGQAAALGRGGGDLLPPARRRESPVATVAPSRSIAACQPSRAVAPTADEQGLQQPTPPAGLVAQHPILTRQVTFHTVAARPAGVTDSGGNTFSAAEERQRALEHGQCRIGERRAVAAVVPSQTAPPGRALSMVRVMAAAVLSDAKAGEPDREPSSRFGHFCAGRVLRRWRVLPT